MKLNIDIKQTMPITSEEGNHVFQEAVMLRKASKFLVGTSEDAVVPIPVFYDIATGKVLLEMLPKELREELKDELC